ncbi:hypothetical protein F2P44_33870 [Massilia sp. CCM 8695]|uniref:Uncharacterized protein n=1 Tax=Massilia frigida TaxID=2609281 RepID=A0ABX0NKP4_9BURK|nr:hypothetical protein [Massilia frigida]NHZ84198.1 hypothetical protein [Massilia frigida]
MFIDLNLIDVRMKIVYELSEKIKADPQSVVDTHALTLDSSRPQMGLKGAFGLYATEEWWDSIYQAEMETLYVSGVIVEAYVAGQEHLNCNNEVDLMLSDGTVQPVGIYVNNKADTSLFQIGHRVDIIYALDELKEQPSKNGELNYLKIALEMAVSLEPVG